MPLKINSRRPLDDEQPDGYLESDNDFVNNNMEAAVWFLENHKRILTEMKAAKDFYRTGEYIHGSVASLNIILSELEE